MDRAALPVIYLARHGETAWSLTGQHTGLTDLPLTEEGERNARKLRDALKRLTFIRVFSSPLRRAWRTCELAGFRSTVEINHDLVEWDYGEYEGRRTMRFIRNAGLATVPRRLPRWRIAGTGRRARNRVVDLVRSVSGNVLLFPVVISSECWPHAGPESHVRCQVFDAEHCELKRSWLRKQSGAAGNSTVERHSLLARRS